MNINKPESDYVNRNVMEILVSEEIDRQINRLPSNIKKFINPIEVSTYALNRLPALYASSQQGFNKQKIKGRSDYSVKITQEVRKGFAAVQKDLLRSSTPLTAEDDQNLDRDIREAQAALQELANYLPKKDLTWKNIVRLVKPILAELSDQDDNAANARKVRSRSTVNWEDSIHKK
ncbi:late competence development ComFB family protein [Waterburya agarophytonicola K14]|uniref:Late competence development ComFB family protein n=1 Tax=Waterburya agarophytonicola KI4 TaxID=2874699 RepID=A0A964BWE9_9CYAN|nr:late competence development ComFB family protein [Waterburya agarophytonicola]MCC0178805.1 late competence development ComFB family protein [Waterburya agarophytonicola KI4]